MTDKKTIYQRLHAVQKALKAPKEENKNVSYKSRSAEQILEAVKDILGEGEYVTLQDDVVKIGSRFYIKSTAVFGFNGEQLSSSSFAREPDDAPLSSYGKPTMQLPQLTGASVSYARKYALGGLFAIDDSKDDPDKQPEQKADEWTRADKINQRDTLYALSACETLEELNSWRDEYSDLIQKLPKPMQEFVDDAADMKEKQIKNGVKVAPVFGFIDVQEAVDYGMQAQKLIDETKDFAVLEDWLQYAHLSALDAKLTAAKYQRPEGTPGQRLRKAAEDKINQLKGK